jgi:signal transduction histidine kinase
MMPPSARTSAALRYTLFFIAVILAVEAVLYFLIRADAYSRLDQNLNTALSVSKLVIYHEIAEHGGKEPGEASIRLVLNTEYSTSFPQDQIVIREGNRLIAYKPNVGSKQVDLRGVDMPFRDIPMNYQDLRIMVQQVQVPSVHTSYTVLVSTWRGDVNNDLRSVLIALAITLPFSFLIVAGGGYFLARRTLAPLAEMSSTIDAITSKNLDLRVRVVNPRDEVGQVATRFNRLLDRLQEVFSQQRRFMADASHELKTPIAAALTAAQVTLQNTGRTEDEHRQALQIVQEQMLRLRRIVQDMFLLAQSDGQVPERKLELVYLDEVVAEACRAVRVLCDNKGVSFRMADLPEALCIGDPGLLRQAIIILLDNACKYTTSGGSVHVALSERDNKYVVAVADTGPGIPPESQATIFERFYRVDKSRSREAADGNGSGAGLGLSIATWIAKIHRGAVRLHSSSPAGSVFTFEIPKPNAEEKIPTVQTSDASLSRASAVSER